MRHRIKGRTLGRNPSHRLSLMRNLATSLFVHESIVTTEAKAKELRPYAEKLITVAKKGAAFADQAEQADGEDRRRHTANALHKRRRLIAALGGKKRIDVGDETIDVVQKLMNEIGPRYGDRPGGYTRIVKLTKRRLGDAGKQAVIQLVGAEPIVTDTDDEGDDSEG